MGKQDILNSINASKSQLQTYEQEKQTLEDKYNTLMDFAGKCSLRATNFNASIQSRRRKLNGLNDILGTVKAAARYKNKMNTMLTGAEYKKAVSNINQLQTVIDSEKNKILNDLKYVNDQISTCKNKITSLQDDYDNYKEGEQ